MTSPHYLKQEEYLRYTLRRFAEHLRARDAVAMLSDGENVLAQESVDAAIEAFIALQPRSTVALILDEERKNVLTVSRPNRPNDLGLPGGKIDPGEKPEEAVVREVEEETGIKIIDPVFCFERKDFTDGRISWCYRVTKWVGEPRKCEDGIEVAWVPLARLLDSSCTFRDYNRALLSALGLG